MQKVTVTTIATHIDDQGITRIAGDSYETAKNYAELRKGSGLVDYDGEGKKNEGQPFLHAGVKSGTEKTTTAIVEQSDNEQGNLVPVDKTALEAAKEADKAKAAAKKVTTVVKEKKEGQFPGSTKTE